MFVWMVVAALVVFAVSLVALLWMSRVGSWQVEASPEVRARREQRMWTAINSERARVDRRSLRGDRRALRAASDEEIYAELDRWTSS